MNITKEEAQQVLDAITGPIYGAPVFGEPVKAAIALLQSKLAEPAHTDHPMRNYDRTCPACQEVEPVVWMTKPNTRSFPLFFDSRVNALNWSEKPIPLFAHPAKQVPMTNDQIYELYSEPRSDAEMVEFARAIEKHHGIGS